MGNAVGGPASASSTASSRADVRVEPPPPAALAARRRSISTPNLSAQAERKRSQGFAGAAPVLCPDPLLPFAPPGAFFDESSPASPPALLAATTAPTHRWFRH